MGLSGEGEMGVRGRGDLVRVAGAVGTASLSLGLAAWASISAVDLGWTMNMMWTDGGRIVWNT